MRPILLFALLVVARAGMASAQFAPELRGRAIDARTGAGLGGVEVALESGEHTVSAVDGTFVFRALAPGERTVIARRVGYAPARARVTLANGAGVATTLMLAAVAVQLPEVAVQATRMVETAGVTVVDRDAIVRSGARDIADVLQRQPALAVTRRGGPGAPATVSIRGSSSNEVLVLVDGVPINSALTGVADLSSVAAADVARVTIVRGAQSARYGAQAMAGVVLVETRRSVEGGNSVSFDGGSWGERGLSTRIAGASESGVSGSLSGEWRRADGAYPYEVPPERGGGPAVRMNGGSERVQVTGAAGIDRDDVSAQLRAELFDINRGMPGSIEQPSLSSRQREQRWSLAGTANIARGSWKVSADAAVQHERARFSDPTPPFSIAYDDSAAVTTVQGRISAATDVRVVSMSGGLDARSLSVDANSLAATAPGAMRYGGAWIGVAYPFGDGEGLRIGGELRADAGARIVGAVLSPRIHAHAARGYLVFDVSWGAGFTPPSMADLFFEEGVQVKPNPDLRPERVHDEVTATIAVRPLTAGPVRADLSFDLFRADIEGMVLWAPNFRYVWSPANFDVTRRGGEAQLRLTSLRGALGATGTLGYADVQYAGPVNAGQVAYRPRWNGGVALTARAGDTDADIAWRYTGFRRTVVGTDLNGLPSFTMLDLHARHRFALLGRETTLRAGLENALDTRAAMLFDFPLPGRTWTAGMTVALGARSNSSHNSAP